MPPSNRDGSPTPRKGTNNFSRKSSMYFSVHEDSDNGSSPSTIGSAPGPPTLKRHNELPMPLTTSKLGNQAPQISSKKQKLDAAKSQIHDKAVMDHLLAKLAQQDLLIQRQKQAVSTEDLRILSSDENSSSVNSIPVTPATETFATTPSTEQSEGDGLEEDEEVSRLKEELQIAKIRIAQMDQELSQTRITNHSLDQVLASPGSPAVARTEAESNGGSRRQRPFYSRHETWTVPMQNDVPPKYNEPLSAGTYNSQREIWGQSAGLGSALTLPAASGQQYGECSDVQWLRPSSRATQQELALPTNMYIPQQGRGVQNARTHALGEPRQAMGPPPPRPLPLRPLSGQNLSRLNSSLAQSDSGSTLRFGDWASYASGLAPMDSYFGSHPPASLPFDSMTVHSSQPLYRPQPIGTPLSPTAAEFNVDAGMTSWNSELGTEQSATYVAPSEPMNYRRLLDRNMSCNWKYIVDKIVCSNDQQASIFLQQKLKVGTPEQKFEIVEAIIGQAYPLMINRFGNFLVQRCFEHGTPEQVIAIANAIRGNTLSLSMDSFGCHVVQKAFDAVPEDYKAIMVHELLRRIPETVIHRHACHVWQKLFELRWSDSPPQIMKYVNEALCGMWHEVALGETGSLVVQNIFENCLEEDKRPCINEVLASVDTVAHGQFGNWCIQHICEHGSPSDRSYAVEHVLRFAVEYSMDQFASKVIEKCLKIGGPDFLDRYLKRVCEGRSERPRMPLVDIAGDQYGNYLVQYILINANPHHREVVAGHIRKHMVSLRGSKFGSRVAMLCCNPAVTTRPGPPAGLQANHYAQHGHNKFRNAYGGAYH